MTTTMAISRIEAKPMISNVTWPCSSRGRVTARPRRRERSRRTARWGRCARRRARSSAHPRRGWWGRAGARRRSRCADGDHGGADVTAGCRRLARDRHGRPLAGGALFASTCRTAASARACPVASSGARAYARPAARAAALVANAPCCTSKTETMTQISGTSRMIASQLSSTSADPASSRRRDIFALTGPPPARRRHVPRRVRGSRDRPALSTSTSASTTAS